MTTHDGMHFNDEAVMLALDLERMGHRLNVKDGALTVTNGKALMHSTIEAIKKHRLMLLSICGYESTRVL